MTYLQVKTPDSLPFGVHLSGGFVAGYLTVGDFGFIGTHLSSVGRCSGIAAFVTTPFDVLKTQLQGSVDHNGKQTHANVVVAARSFYNEVGLRGFARGATARVLWVAPGTAITMVSYEQFKKLLYREFGWLPHHHHEH